MDRDFKCYICNCRLTDEESKTLLETQGYTPARRKKDWWKSFEEGKILLWEEPDVDDYNFWGSGKGISPHNNYFPTGHLTRKDLLTKMGDIIDETKNNPDNQSEIMEVIGVLSYILYELEPACVYIQYR